MRPTKLALVAAARQVHSLLQAGLPGKSLAGLLAVALLIALANAALAGPTGSTTTSLPGGTTTTTTTIAATTTTTAAPTTTPTTTTTSSTTSTTIPNDLSGQYPFLDKKSGDNNESYMNVDTALGQICVAGAVREIDATVTYNRSVTFTYTSNGTITKATDKKVDADFASVELELFITELSPGNEGGPEPEYNNPDAPLPPITVPCKLKASLKQPKGPQSGERALDRVNLDCDVGENFSAFPDLSEEFLANIQDAYANRKNVKADLKKGRLKIKTNGSEVLDGDDSDIDSSCTLALPTTTTTTGPTTTSTTGTTAPPTTSTSSTTSTTPTT